MPSKKCIRIDSPYGLPIYHLGPPFNDGPLASFFYFALSGRESLELDPYNQPVTFLNTSRIRVFSFSIPGHSSGEDHRQGMRLWAEGLLQSPDYLENFFRQAIENIDYLVAEGWIDPRHIAVGGLSRGGLIGTHLAARYERIKTVVGFSPLTCLKPLEEFSELPQESLNQLNLESQIPMLIHKQLRYYIGNRDIRVGTKSCFHFIHRLTESAFEAGVRSPKIELEIFPSIGHRGHGTPPAIFEAGARWLKLILDREQSSTLTIY